VGGGEEGGTHAREAGAAVWKVRRTSEVMRPAVCELMVYFLVLRKYAVVKVRMASPAKVGEHWVQRQRSLQRNGLTEYDTEMCANCGGGCQSCIHVAAGKCLHQLATSFFCEVAMKYVCGGC
jgi:hypothetical protein